MTIRTTTTLGLICAFAAVCLACGKAEGASESARAATTGTEVTAPTDCPERAADLPRSTLYDARDKRLREGTLIVVLKHKRRLMLYRDGRLAQLGGSPACFRVGLGDGAPKGHKQREGDRKTPEGWYRTSDKPSSRWYGAIAIHYPNVADAKRGLAAKAIDKATYRRIVSAIAADKKPPQRTALGGEILIHGGGSAVDWTLGCVAMDNPRLDLLRDRLPSGLRADILILR